MSSSSFTPSTNLANFATASQAGIVSTTAQTFGGAKTFQDAPFIGNASGIVAASDTVPGVVTTGAQTFAGDKTFNGVLSITGRINATSPTSSYVGYVVQNLVDPSTVVSTTNTWTQMGAGFTVPAGNWIISIYGYINGTTNITKGEMGWGTSSVPDTQTLTSGQKMAAAGKIHMVCPMRYVSYSAQQTIKVFMARADGSSDYGLYYYTLVRMP